MSSEESKPADVQPETNEGTPMGTWARAKHLVATRILKVDDTPHRIAFGVALGFFVGATPTIGFQMIIYVGIAAVVGANKLSGILPVWLSNPVTAVPLYYGNWKLGRLLMTGKMESSPETKAALDALFTTSSELTLIQRLTSSHFWDMLRHTLFDIGLELWVGSVLVGTVFAAIFYWITYRAVRAYRAHKETGAA